MQREAMCVNDCIKAAKLFSSSGYLTYLHYVMPNLVHNAVASTWLKSLCMLVQPA